MLELRTFGGLAIKENGVPLSGAAVQRKTLALLALLAAAGRKGVSRDKLAAYLWPERDADHARHLLKQSCYALRHDLKEPELLLGATELRLNPAVISSDVQAFEEALDGGDVAAAGRTYAGPFLDGFYVDGAGEFERWADAERARLLKRVCGALESVATAATARGDVRDAMESWRRLTELDPLSSRAALGLMTVLDAAGERAKAIEHGQAHEAFVQAEFGADPAPQVVALIERLQKETANKGRLPHSAHATTAGNVGETTSPNTVAVPYTLLRQLRRADVLSRFAVAAVVVLLATGVAAYAFWPRQPDAARVDVPADRKMLAVLPFQNLGSPDDDYFADGLSEAIAMRLGSIQRLGVIGWSSASQYKRTGQSPQEIGRELGVQYILQGSVRWEKASGTSRVRVSPALIRVADAAQLWSDQYDTVLAGVFAVQTNLATRVAGALDIALVDAERRVLEARPTANLQAYDLYLRGRVLVDREFDPANVRTASRLYEQAVALDSDFAPPYAWLSVAYVWMHDAYMDRSPKQLTRAKVALDRVLHLAPDLPESHGALGFYYFRVVGDYDQALEQFALARKGRPSDPYLAGTMGDIYMTEGRWKEALAYGREAAALDPRNVLVAIGTGNRYTELRQFTAAMYYYDRALALKPQSFDAQLGKVLAYLGQTGDLAGARRLLPDLSRPLDPSGAALPILALCDVVTLLDASRQAQMLALTPTALDGDSAVLALSKGMVYHARRQESQARFQFDSARVILQRKVRHETDESYYHALLGLALAGLGRSSDAVREGERAVDLVPVSKDAEWSGYLRANLARIDVLLGEREKAIDHLEILLSRPGELSAGWLRADPFWDPLRGSPRFQRLAAARN